MKIKYRHLILPLLIIVGVFFLNTQISYADPNVTGNANGNVNAPANPNTGGTTNANNGLPWVTSTTDKSQNESKEKAEKKAEDKDKKDKKSISAGTYYSDPKDIYNNYFKKTVTFSLLVKEPKSSNWLSKMLAGPIMSFRNMMWSLTSFMGVLSTYTAQTVFSIDITKPLIDQTATMVQRGSSGVMKYGPFIAVIAVSSVVIFVYFPQQRYKSILSLMISVFVLFAIAAGLSNKQQATKTVQLSNNIDANITNIAVSINPAFPEKGDINQATSMDKISNTIASTVYYNTVYKPYLAAQYGTTDEKEILKKKVKDQNGDEQNRIAILLNNPESDTSNDDLWEAIAKNEVETIKNPQPTVAKSGETSILLLLYAMVNTCVFFVLLVLGLFIKAFNVLRMVMFMLIGIFILASFFKRDLITGYVKSLVVLSVASGIFTFMAVFTTSLMTLGFDAANTSSNLIIRILYIIFYAAMPYILYKFLPLLAVIMNDGMATKGLAIQALTLGTNPFKGVIPRKGNDHSYDKGSKNRRKKNDPNNDDNDGKDDNQDEKENELNQENSNQKSKSDSRNNANTDETDKDSESQETNGNNDTSSDRHKSDSRVPSNADKKTDNRNDDTKENNSKDSDYKSDSRAPGSADDNQNRKTPNNQNNTENDPREYEDKSDSRAPGNSNHEQPNKTSENNQNGTENDLRDSENRSASRAPGNVGDNQNGESSDNNQNNTKNDLSNSNAGSDMYESGKTNTKENDKAPEIGQNRISKNSRDTNEKSENRGNQSNSSSKRQNAYEKSRQGHKNLNNSRQSGAPKTSTNSESRNNNRTNSGSTSRKSEPRKGQTVSKSNQNLNPSLQEPGKNSKQSLGKKNGYRKTHDIRSRKSQAPVTLENSKKSAPGPRVEFRSSDSQNGLNQP